MFSAIGQALLTQTRYTLPQGHHLTMSTPNSIIPDRLVVPGEHHLTGPEAVHVFTHHSDGSPIPELPSQHLSSQPGIKPLASLCHQSLQETPYSKLHSIPHLDSASGALREQMCGTCDCACMDAFLCVCACVLCLYMQMCAYMHVCVHVRLCVLFVRIQYTRRILYSASNQNPQSYHSCQVSVTMSFCSIRIWPSSPAACISKLLQMLLTNT